MKKIIILTIATLSTGIVLSNSLKKTEVLAKPMSTGVNKTGAANQKNGSTPSYDVIATAD